MCLAHGPQRSDAGEARTRGPSVLSEALYPWATALPSLDRGLIKLSTGTCTSQETGTVYPGNVAT